MAESEAIITEASVKEFEKQLSEKENALKLAEEKYLKRLVQEAREAGVEFKEEKELIEIGEKFGGKDHSTVLHSIKKVEERMSKENK